MMNISIIVGPENTDEQQVIFVQIQTLTKFKDIQLKRYSEYRDSQVNKKNLLETKLNNLLRHSYKGLEKLWNKTSNNFVIIQYLFASGDTTSSLECSKNYGLNIFSVPYLRLSADYLSKRYIINDK